MNICIIVNPKSGQHSMEQVHAVVEGLPGCEVWTTERAGHARGLAAEAARRGAEVVVAAGGDGTIGEVIQGLAPYYGRVKFGILPLGTGNDFARSLGTPLHTEWVREALVEGHSRRIDVVRVRHGDEVLRHFANVSFSGFCAETKHRVEDQFKNNWGPLGYLRAAMEGMPDVYPHRILLDFAGGEVEELSGSILVVANGAYMSAGLAIAPGAEVDDGELDLLVIKPATVTELAVLAPFVLSGTHLGGEWVYHRRAAAVTVHATPQLPVNVDDVCLTYPSLTYEVLPGALEVLTPEHRPQATGILGTIFGEVE